MNFDINICRQIDRDTKERRRKLKELRRNTKQINERYGKKWGYVK